MLSCKHITEYASDYVEGKMSFWQRLQFRMHLRACVHCSRFLRHLGLSISYTGKCLHETATEAEILAVLERIRTAEA
jgi:hypothetical protein